MLDVIHTTMIGLGYIMLVVAAVAGVYLAISGVVWFAKRFPKLFSAIFLIAIILWLGWAVGYMATSQPN